jgi:hypothetical protein
VENWGLTGKDKIMGWDAFATKDGFDIDRNWNLDSDKNPEIVDPILARAFGQAEEIAKGHAGAVDWMVRLGGLDCSGAAEMLERVGINAWGDDLPAADVQKFDDLADWNFPIRPDDKVFYWSARMFLRTCAAHGLGIRFSW